MNLFRTVARHFADANLRRDNDAKVALLKAAATKIMALQSANAGLATDADKHKRGADTLRRLLEIEKEIAAERYGEILGLRDVKTRLEKLLDRARVENEDLERELRRLRQHCDRCPSYQAVENDDKATRLADL